MIQEPLKPNRFTVWNGTAHPCRLYERDQVHQSRSKKNLVEKTPNTEVEYVKYVDKVLNISQEPNRRESPTIDEQGLIQAQEDFYPPKIDFPHEARDIIIASSRYFLGVLHRNPYRWRFYIDSLYISQPVYDRDPEREAAKMVGCFLKKAMPPLRPADYVWAFRQRIPVSTAGLCTCVSYYQQWEIACEEAKEDPQFYYNLDAVKRQLDYQLAVNQTLPENLFPTRVTGKNFNQAVSPVMFSA